MAVNPYQSAPAHLAKYLELDQFGISIAEYIWIDADSNVRSKAMVSVHQHPPKDPLQNRPCKTLPAYFNAGLRVIGSRQV